MFFFLSRNVPVESSIKKSPLCFFYPKGILRNQIILYYSAYRNPTRSEPHACCSVAVGSKMGLRASPCELYTRGGWSSMPGQQPSDQEKDKEKER
jgi:hypothetical protein